jgi:hypothetical protein
LVLAIQIDKVDGKLHAYGMHGLTRYDPKALARSKTLASQQALAALWTAVGNFEAGCKNGVTGKV